MITNGGKVAVAQTDPQSAWRGLSQNPYARLIDVRTRPEWAFVGVPELADIGGRLWTIEWRRYPDMSPNPEFEASFRAQYAQENPRELYFLCRSGARSLEAARHASNFLSDEPVPPTLFNVAEGFEGDLDANGQRGIANGWKAHGLPWRQS